MLRQAWMRFGHERRVRDEYCQHDYHHDSGDSDDDDDYDHHYCVHRACHDYHHDSRDNCDELSQ
ncbi:MAG: hypothetical protein JZU63_11255 [Rhodoferax sp.]|nr:hypothetical protein [Rhodoferax sp.]